MSDFSELLQKAEQLSAEFTLSGAEGGIQMGSGPIRSDCPRVERSLRQLVDAGQQLFSKSKKGHAGINLASQDVKASVLLGSRGVDLPSMATKLDTLDALVAGSDKERSFAPIEPVRDTDVTGFLKNERENAILSVIEETKLDTFRNSERLHWESTMHEWEEEKQKILNDLSAVAIESSEDSPDDGPIATRLAHKSSKRLEDLLPIKILESVAFDSLPPEILESVALDSEKRGMIDDNITLSDLAVSYEKVIPVLNKLLAEVATKPNIPESRRYRLQKEAVEIAQRHKQYGTKSSQVAMAEFFLLLDLMTYFDAYHAKLNENALNIILKINLLPFSEGEMNTMVATFRQLSDGIRLIIPDVLLATMSLLFLKYQSRKIDKPTPSTPTGMSITPKRSDGGGFRYLSEIREKARALLTYAGMIPYRLPGDTYAKLLQMETKMN